MIPRQPLADTQFFIQVHRFDYRDKKECFLCYVLNVEGVILRRPLVDTQLFVQVHRFDYRDKKE